MESYAHQNWCKYFRGRRPRKCFHQFWCAYHSLRTPTPTSKKPAENIGANIRVGVRKSVYCIIVIALTLKCQGFEKARSDVPS